MSSSNSIQNQFRKAGIPVRIVSDASEVNRAFAVHTRAARASNNGAFLMDILTRKGREEFVISPGTADVQVPGVDPKRRQAILFVKEAARTIRFEEWSSEAHRRVERMVREPESKRHFLVGMDESHLFACPLSRGVSNVEAAHRTLAPSLVHEARRRGLKVLRQGEFFFIPASDSEVAEIEIQVATHGIPAKEPLGGRDRRGRPHIVDQDIVMANRTEYARGTVRHPEHHALLLKGWHRVVLNTEATPRSPVGMTWVD